MNSFYINGHLGDTIYCLYAIMKAGGGDLFIDSVMKDGDGSPNPNWNDEYAHSVAELVMCQNYIKSCTLVSDGCPPEAFNFDLARKSNDRSLYFETNRPDWPGNFNLKKKYFIELFKNKMCVSEMITRFKNDEPWLTIPPYPWKDIKKFDVVVHAPVHKMTRSKEDWAEILGGIGSTGYKIGIIGGADVKDFPSGPWDVIRPANMADAARYIAKSKVFVGTASCCYVIAEGFHKIRFTEVFGNAKGCAPKDETGWDIDGWKVSDVVSSVRKALENS